MRRRSIIPALLVALVGVVLAVSAPAATHSAVPDVTNLRLRATYGRLTVSWQTPTFAGFDHIAIWEQVDDATPFLAYKGTDSTASFSGIDNSKDYILHVNVVSSAGVYSPGKDVEFEPSTFLFAPEEGVQVDAPPRLSWAAVPGARFYNVQLYQNGEKLFTSWPRTRHLQLHGAWHYAGHRRVLHPGRIHWYVWPAFGTRANPDYGKPLGASSFIVPGSACKASLSAPTC